MNEHLYLPKKYNNPSRLLKALRITSERSWIKAGERRVLELFQEMAKRVPAYKDFLKKNKVDSLKIRSMADFRQVQTIDKDNYLKEYPLEKLCWDGQFKNRRWVISATSGSTGKPFYFPRERAQDLQYAAIAELYLLTNFDIRHRATLYIDAFPMGVWIGGLFTYEAIKTIAERGKYHLSIITTSVDKKEIINAIKKFGKAFDQIIVGCYGPFLKDVIDEGLLCGIDWKKYNLKFVFSAEGFSEEFRDYIIQKTGLKDIYRGTLNHYGTVDQGTLAYETPISILIRRIAVKKSPMLYENIFPKKNKLPTLCQFDPELFFFEQVSENLLCSSFSGLPLVRYDLKDYGGIIGYETMIDKVKESGIDLIKELKTATIENTVWRLPFVYVYERRDLSISLFAFQLYPEPIRRVLLRRQFNGSLTGKFTMITRYDHRANQFFELNIELKPNIHKSEKLKTLIEEMVIECLLDENSEYRKTYADYPEALRPHVVFWPHEHSAYFRSGGKQKWVSKENK